MNETYIVDLASPPAIIETDSRRSDEVRKRLEQIDSNLTITTFEQAFLWAEVKENAYWSNWKFQSLKEYIQKSGVDLSPREIDYRIGIAQGAKLLGINTTSLTLAKISKLKLIFSLDPNATAIESGTGNEEKMGDIMVKLVADAPNKTLKEIKAIVDQLKGETEEDDEFTWLNVKLRKDSKEVIMQAVNLVVVQSGSTIDVMTKEEKDISIGIAIERLAADYLASPDNQAEDFEENEAGHFVDSHDDSGGDGSQDDELEFEGEQDDTQFDDNAEDEEE